jgi:ferredoxin
VSVGERRAGGAPVSAVRGPRLRVNPITCVGHGMYAELLPEFVALDPWGYPIIQGDPVPDHLVGLAIRAAAACPTLALLFDD